MLTKVKSHFKKYLAVCLTAILFLAPLQSFGVSPEAPFREGENSFAFSAGSWGEYVFYPEASGMYLIQAASSEYLDCYVSIKGAEDSYILDNIEGTDLSFLLKLSAGETCFLDLFSLRDRDTMGSVTITYMGEVTGFTVLRQPEKKDYIVGIDAAFYRGAYMISNLDLTGCAVAVQLDDGTSLLFEDQAVGQFISLKNYSFSSMGQQDLAPSCMDFRGSIPIVLREATEKERIGAYAAAVRQFYGFDTGLTAENAASALFFDGRMTRENADRLVWAAFSFAGQSEPHLHYRYADPKTDTYRIPPEDMETLLTQYFTIASVVPEYSTYYNEAESMYILPMDQNFPAPDTDLILESLIVRLNPDDTRRVSFLFGGKGQLILTLADRENGYAVCGVEWGSVEEIVLKPDDSYLLEDHTGFVLNIPLEIGIAEFMGHFEEGDVLVLKDAAGDPVTADFVGTGMSVSKYDAQGVLLDRVTAVVRGDLNGDGMVSTVDYMRVRKLFAQTYTAAPAEKEAADVNGDGEISSADYIRIKKHFDGSYKIQ